MGRVSPEARRSPRVRADLRDTHTQHIRGDRQPGEEESERDNAKAWCETLEEQKRQKWET